MLFENSEEKMTPQEIDQAMKTGRDRPHRRTHGKVQFKVLTSRVSAKWRTLPADEKAVFIKQAGIEAKRYQAEAAKWRKERAMKMMKQVVSSISVSDDEESVNSQPLHTEEAADNEPLHLVEDEPLSLDTSSMHPLNIQTQMEPDIVSAGSLSPCNMFSMSPCASPEPVDISFDSFNTPCFSPELQVFPQHVQLSPIHDQEVSLGVQQMVGLLSHLGELASTLDDDCFDMLSQLK